jgi:hypothetical protein
VFPHCGEACRSHLTQAHPPPAGGLGFLKGIVVVFICRLGLWGEVVCQKRNGGAGSALARGSFSGMGTRSEGRIDAGVGIRREPELGRFEEFSESGFERNEGQNGDASPTGPHAPRRCVAAGSPVLLPALT